MYTYMDDIDFLRVQLHLPSPLNRRSSAKRPLPFAHVVADVHRLSLGVAKGILKSPECFPSSGDLCVPNHW